MSSHITSITVPTEVTQCPVCCELLKDARQLPNCLHVYCLKCVEAFTGWQRSQEDDYTGADDEDRKTGICPLCAVVFDIPDDGPSSLPRNGFFEKLVEARKLKKSLEADDDQAGCELCEPEPLPPQQQPDQQHPELMTLETLAVPKKAAHYCVDCGQRMCEQCGSMHRRMKATSAHQLIELGVKNTAAAEAIEKQLQTAMTAATSCPTHPAENLKVYCNDCRAAICTMCHIESHNGHDCADILRVADELRRNIRDDVKQLNSQISRCRTEMSRLDKAKADFARTVLKIQMQIGESTERLKRIIDDHRKKLMAEVAGIGDSRRRDTESVEADVNRHLSALETFCRYSEELADRGSACDIAEAAERIRRRADTLRLFDVAEHVADNFKPVNVTFAPATATTTGALHSLPNVIGTINVGKEAEKEVKVEAPSPAVEKTRPPSADVQTSATTPAPNPPAPAEVTTESAARTTVLVHVSPAGGRPVLGVAAAGEEVYITRHATQEIEVYDAAHLTLRRRIQMPGLGSWPFGLAVGTGCLYVSDFVNNAVHRAETHGMSTVTARWQVPGGPAGLSVIGEGEDAGNVVVVCSTALKIQVYAAQQGTLMYEIRLRADQTPGPSHAIRLIGGQFLLSHASGSAQAQNQAHRICIVEKVDSEEETAASPPAPGAPADQQPQQKQHKKFLPALRRDSKKPPKQPAAPVSTDAAPTGHASYEARIVLSYGAAPGSADGQLSAPRGIAVDSRRGGCVFVADRDNNRVVVVDHALGAGRQLKFTVGPDVEDGQLHSPRCVYLDHNRSRLYIGEETDGGRLVAIDNVDVAADELA